MNFITFTFSGTGNTRWAVETFNRILAEKGQQGSLVRIDAGENLSDEKLQQLIAAADGLGFANPIYGGDIPPIMRRFIRRLAALPQVGPTEKKAFVINTFGYANAFGPTVNEKLLAAAGMSLQAYTNIRLCSNTPSSKPAAKPFDRDTLRKRMAAGSIELTHLADALIAGKKRLRGHGPQNLIGVMIRKKVPEAIAKHYQHLGVHEATCTRCLVCVDNCPTRSIHFDAATGFSFQAGCTACMRCYNFCPTGAITIDGVYADPRQFPRYHGPEGANDTGSC